MLIKLLAALHVIKHLGCDSSLNSPLSLNLTFGTCRVGSQFVSFDPSNNCSDIEVKMDGSGAVEKC